MHNNPFPMLNFCLFSLLVDSHTYLTKYIWFPRCTQQIVRRAYIRLFLKQGRGKINQGKPLPLAQANLNNLQFPTQLLVSQKDTECPSHIHELTIKDLPMVASSLHRRCQIRLLVWVTD